MTGKQVGYDDGGIACDDQALTIRRYYPWGAKRVPYTEIRSVASLPLTGPNQIRRLRIWGSADFVHWWNFDRRRPGKHMALVIDNGHRVHPTITPDDPDAVDRILAEQVSHRVPPLGASRHDRPFAHLHGV